MSRQRTNEAPSRGSRRSCVGRGLAAALLAMAVVATGGCHLFDLTWKSSPPEGEKSLLPPPRMSKDAVVLDVYKIRIPPERMDLYEDLWRAVDEQHFSLETRRALTEEGFRAGVVGSHVPEQLSRLMELKNKPAPTIGPRQVQAEDSTRDAASQYRHIQLRDGDSADLCVSSILPTWRHYYWRDEQLCCDTLYGAQGLFRVTPDVAGGEGPVLRLTPEIRHGESTANFEVQDGALRIMPKQQSEIFDKMRLDARLRPGEMLLVGPVDAQTTGAAFNFFINDKANSGEIRLLAVRLSQTQDDRLFDPGRLFRGE